MDLVEGGRSRLRLMHAGRRVQRRATQAVTTRSPKSEARNGNLGPSWSRSPYKTVQAGRAGSTASRRRKPPAGQPQALRAIRHHEVVGAYWAGRYPASSSSPASPGSDSRPAAPLSLRQPVTHSAPSASIARLRLGRAAGRSGGHRVSAAGADLGFLGPIQLGSGFNKQSRTIAQLDSPDERPSSPEPTEAASDPAEADERSGGGRKELRNGHRLQPRPALVQQLDSPDGGQFTYAQASYRAATVVTGNGKVQLVPRSTLPGAAPARLSIRRASDSNRRNKAMKDRASGYARSTASGPGVQGQHRPADSSGGTKRSIRTIHRTGRPGGYRRGQEIVRAASRTRHGQFGRTTMERRERRTMP